MSAGLPRAIVIGCVLAWLAAEAQSPGGQRRSRLEPRAAQERADDAPRARRTMDPVFALERELPSLRTDLKLDDSQDRLWGPFDRSVRDAAEVTRQRMKRMMAPRAEDAPAPDAPGILAALAADERTRADAMAEAGANLKALYASLAPAQRTLFDRRVLLSQSEPLGTR